MISRRSLFGLFASLPFVGKAFADRSDIIIVDDPHARIFASKGEHVTCENGHFVCEFTRDVKFGEFFDPQVLGNWRQPAPQRGTMHTDAPCAICGAYWFQGTNYHFADGWR